MKKYLPLIGIAFTIIVIVFLFWFFFLRPTDNTLDSGGTNSGSGFGTFFDSENNQRRNFTESLGDLPEEAFVQNSKIPILRQLSDEPIAGYTFFQKEFEIINNDLGTTTDEDVEDTVLEGRYVFRFMERGTGHIYETREDSMTIEKVTNTTVQQVTNAMFSSNGNKVLFEKLSEGEESIDSFIGEIVLEIEEGGAEEKILQIQPYSILSSFFSLSPDENSFAYLTQNQNSSNLYVGDFNSNEEIIFQSPIKEWVIEWSSDNLISMFTKPSSSIPGYGYLLNTSNGSTEKVLNQIDGLTFKSNSEGDSVIYSETRGGTIALKYKNLDSNETRTFAVSTFPEKCAFSKTDSLIVYCGIPRSFPGASYPDDWYKGRVSFEDMLWKINLSTGRSESIYNFSTNDYGNFDIVNMQVTEEDQFITFKNRNDLTLWSLNLEAMNNSDAFIADSPVDL